MDFRNLLPWRRRQGSAALPPEPDPTPASAPEAKQEEVPDPRPRVFRVWTDWGSVFAFKLEPRRYVHGVEVGPVDVRGHSERAEKLVRIIGIGAEPFVGGEITVSDEPYEIVDLGEGPVAFYPSETIVRVREIPVPDEALEPQLSAQPA